MITIQELSHRLNVTSNQISNIIRQLDLKDQTEKNGRSTSIKPIALRAILESRGFIFPKINIATCNLKGGVGKTSVAVGLAQQISNYGFKTLLVDCDKQANATERLWPESTEKEYPTLFEVLTHQVKVKDSIVSITESLDLLPSDLQNQLLDERITEKNINLGGYFKKVLSELEYDVVVFDTEPDLSKINFMAMASCDLVLAPMRQDRDSIKGLRMLQDFLGDQKEEWPEIKAEIRPIINFLDGRMTSRALNKVSEIQEGGFKLMNTLIRVDNEFSDAQITGAINRKSKAYEDIDSLVDEVFGLSSVAKKVQ
jgi:chromosome partitioning protein